MNKITVIQLLNKIAKNEEVPKIIKWDGFKYHWNEELDDWQNENEDLFLSSLNYVNEILNEEVEIIEDKEIRTLPPYKYEDEVLKLDLAKKIDELIDEINELKKGK